MRGRSRSTKRAIRLRTNKYCRTLRYRFALHSRLGAIASHRGQSKVGKNLDSVLALIVLVLIAAPTFASTDEVPDPCKLLTEGEVNNTLGIDGPVAIELTPVAPSIAQLRVVDRGAGNIGLAIPASSGPRTNTLVCGARAGSIKLSIGVTAIPQAKVDEQESSTELDLLERKRGIKVEGPRTAAPTVGKF
jgi:hypothetical protein